MKNHIKTQMDILGASLKLGLTSFGGPIAHLGYFKNEYVDKRKWLDEQTYTQIIALCQFLPGPASSQVGMAIGMLRGGILGGILSFIGFTLPSVLMLVLFALLYGQFQVADMGMIQGLKLVAVAVVAHAVFGMGKKLTDNRTQVFIAVIAAIVSLLSPLAFTQVAIIIVAGMIGKFIYKNGDHINSNDFINHVSKRAGIISFVIFGFLLIGLPIINSIWDNQSLRIFDAFFRSGSLVFGGGHVVLPILESEVVPTGWVNKEEFLAGYGMAQAVPGPLFTFASYLGTVINGVFGAILATLAIFLPAFLLITGSLPFFNEVRNKAAFQGILKGVGAAVVGILLAALYDPVWTSAVKTNLDFSIVLVLYIGLSYFKMPSWAVVLLGAILGIILM